MAKAKSDSFYSKIKADIIRAEELAIKKLTALKNRKMKPLMKRLRELDKHRKELLAIIESHLPGHTSPKAQAGKKAAAAPTVGRKKGGKRTRMDSAAITAAVEAVKAAMPTSKTAAIAKSDILAIAKVGAGSWQTLKKSLGDLKMVGDKKTAKYYIGK